MQVGDLVCLKVFCRWAEGDLGMIIEIQSDGAYLVQFFSGLQVPCTESEIGVINQ